MKRHGGTKQRTIQSFQKLILEIFGQEVIFNRKGAEMRSNHQFILS